MKDRPFSAKTATSEGTSAAPSSSDPGSAPLRAEHQRVRLFVYGTLKRGYRHHDRLRGTYVRDACTTFGFFIVRFAGYPALSYEESDEFVEGELFEIASSELVELDRFEDVPDEYQRASIRLEDGSWAQAYLMQPAAVSSKVRLPRRWSSRDEGRS